MDFEVTYYRHEIEGAIQAIDAQTQLDLCVQTLDALTHQNAALAEQDRQRWVQAH